MYIIDKCIEKWKPGILILLYSILLCKAQEADATTNRPPVVQYQENNHLTNMQTILTTTQEPNVTTLGNLQVQTYEGNPYIKVISEDPVASFTKTTQLIDIKHFQLNNWNSQKFLISHSENKNQYTRQSQFISNTPEKYIQAYHDNVTSISYMPPQMEYNRMPESLNFRECMVSCAILEANMPATKIQLHESANLFQLTDNDFVWINTTQRSLEKSNWSWGESAFNYNIVWNGDIIYPPNYSIADWTFKSSTKCQAYRRDQPISHEQIGYRYQYYNGETYNNKEPHALYTKISKDWQCRVMTPEEDTSEYNTLDNANCICVRPKKKAVFENKDIEAKEIYSQLQSLVYSKEIEDWRYRAFGDMIYLEEVETDEIKPRFLTNVDGKLEKYKTSYINEYDLNEIQLDNTMPHPLKLKKLGKTLFENSIKVFLSNPANIHQEMAKLFEKNKNAGVVKTDAILGSDQEMNDKMKSLFPNYTFLKNKTHITIKPLETFDNWYTLSHNMTDNKAQIGINQAKETNRNYKFLISEILPALIRNNKIDENSIHTDTEIILRQEYSITIIKQYGSYIVLNTYIPTYLKKQTRNYRFISLPHDYMEETGKWITKNLPERIVTQPGTNDITNNTSKCKTQLIKEVGDLTDCENKEATLEDLNYIETIGEYRLYLLKALGDASVSCPGWNLEWHKFHHDVNVLLLHQSCHFQVRHDKFALSIEPISNQVPQEISSKIILQYSFETSWQPDSNTKWIIQLVIVSVLGFLVILTIIAAIYIMAKKPKVYKIATRLEQGRKLVHEIQHLKDIAKKDKEDPSYIDFQDITQDLQRDYKNDFHSMNTDHASDIVDYYADKSEMYATIKPSNVKRLMNQKADIVNKTSDI